MILLSLFFDYYFFLNGYYYCYDSQYQMDIVRLQKRPPSQAFAKCCGKKKKIEKNGGKSRKTRKIKKLEKKDKNKKQNAKLIKETKSKK